MNSLTRDEELDEEFIYEFTGSGFTKDDRLSVNIYEYFTITLRTHGEYLVVEFTSLLPTTNRTLSETNEQYFQPTSKKRNRKNHHLNPAI